MSPTDAPHDPPAGNDAGYAIFPKDRTTRVDDGTRIAWTVLLPEGDEGRTPILAVNGWSCTDAYWVHIVPALTALGHPVVVVDARGHAASGLPRAPGRGARGLRPEDISIERMARDLIAVLDEAGLDEVVVMGHSMGVQIGLELDRLDPGRAAGLVLIAGSYENPMKTFMGLSFIDRVFPIGRDLALRTPAPLMRAAMAPARISNVATWLARRASAAGPKAAADDMAPYLRHLADADVAVLMRTLDAMRDHSAADHLAHVSAPTLILAAGKDTFTPPECSTHMSEHIPDAEIRWFPDSHHTLPIEEPEAIVEAIDEWHGRHLVPDQPATTPGGTRRKGTAR